MNLKRQTGRRDQSHVTFRRLRFAGNEEKNLNLKVADVDFFPCVILFFQRHTLRAVPVSEVKYEWKDDTSRYWVYGLDHKVHAPDYPQQCCCGCSIL